MTDDTLDVADDGPRWSTDRRTFAVPLTIGVLSDTHIYARGQRRLPDEVLDLFRRFRCGLIVHCGDINVAPVLDRLAEIAPVIAVEGNNDQPDVTVWIGEEAWFDVGPHRFVAVHGHGGRSARQVARTYAGKAACVLYGHSHQPMIEEEDGTILFNPGSPTDRRWGEHFGVGIVHVTEDAVIPELVLFSEPAHLVNVEPGD